MKSTLTLAKELIGDNLTTENAPMMCRKLNEFRTEAYREGFDNAICAVAGIAVKLKVRTMGGTVNVIVDMKPIRKLLIND